MFENFFNKFLSAFGKAGREIINEADVELKAFLKRVDAGEKVDCEILITAKYYHKYLFENHVVAKQDFLKCEPFYIISSLDNITRAYRHYVYVKDALDYWSKSQNG